MHTQSTDEVSTRPKKPPAPGAVVAFSASSAVEAETSQPSIIQMPITSAPANPANVGNGACTTAPATGACTKPATALAASTHNSTIASTFATRDVGAIPRQSSNPAASTHTEPTVAFASGAGVAFGARSASVYAPAGADVATTAKMLATIRIHAAYAPATGPKASATHVYDEPAFGSRAPSRA